MGLVVAYEAKDEMSAISVRDLLIQHGILASIQSRDRLAGKMDYRYVGWGQVLVNEEDFEAALEQIAGFEGTLGELAELEGLPPGKDDERTKA